jgi:Zn-finger nucleic acid-binding protein
MIAMMSAQIILLLPFDSKQQIFRNAAQQIFRNHQPAGCRCPPPTIIPRAQASDRPRVCTGRPCPRCSGALCSLRVQQTELLACERCFGTFLSNEAVLRLDGPLGASLRGTQKQPATVAPGPVRYIPCVTCRQLMNRQVFARISGVIVDVCKDHGVWFDTGEVDWRPHESAPPSRGSRTGASSCGGSNTPTWRERAEHHRDRAGGARPRSDLGARSAPC